MHPCQRVLSSSPLLPAPHECYVLFRPSLVRHVLSLQHRGISQPATRLPQEIIRLPQSAPSGLVAMKYEVRRPAESVSEMDPKALYMSIHWEL
ncbi:hypothetical protein PSPO01_07970 [Paraphaeosphaeria sporulosa]